jgi:thiamine-monophosphate kinase
MNEYEMIRTLAARFRRSPEQANAPFESDAEFVRMGGEWWGMTVDEFSPGEDLFAADDPRRLGSNLVTATVSDLLAAGVEPRFFLHALCLPRAGGDRFAEALCDGMADALDRAGCALCGGDLGTADPWRYTGFALGPLRAPQPLTRRLPPRNQTLWITGALGGLNAAAFSRSGSPALALRLPEARCAWAVALAGIDTSGGLADALWMLSQASPGVRLAVDLAALPYAPGVRETCEAAGIPIEAALFGGAGEYELLFAAPDGLGAADRARLSAAGLMPIGQAFPAAAGVEFRLANGATAPMSGPPPCPRGSDGPERHAREAIAAAAALLGRAVL